jgi:hypothetical protein
LWHGKCSIQKTVGITVIFELQTLFAVRSG